MPDLYQALYFSRARVPDSPAVHHDILSISRYNNAQAGITGFLHREGDNFIQYLEGPKSRLYDTLTRIGRDPRHDRFEVVKCSPLNQRMLPQWEMAFTDQSALMLSDLLGTPLGQLDITGLDPFDLVVFMLHNSQSLRSNT